jgi:hypothetical protein
VIFAAVALLASTRSWRLSSVTPPSLESDDVRSSMFLHVNWRDASE